MTREDLARSLALNTSLRQTLGATPKFTDVSGDLRDIAEAVTANGSTLRDYDFAPTGMMSVTGTTFNPTGTVNRLDLAVALVKALGHDAEARALANSTVTFNGSVHFRQRADSRGASRLRADRDQQRIVRSVSGRSIGRSRRDSSGAAGTAFRAGNNVRARPGGQA